MTVTVYLGEKERELSVEVNAIYDKGDWYNPPSCEFEVGTIYDQDGIDVTELVERYENIYKVDFNELAIDEYKNEY